ncbi:MAG: helix-turn-helix domain-containing protein [Pseudonocardiaceae bacterium]
MGTAGIGGARVAELRKAHGLTQVVLARRAGVSVGLLSKIEVGDRMLTPANAAAVARACGFPSARFTGRPKSPRTKARCWRICAPWCAATTCPITLPCPTPPSCAWIWTRPEPWCSKPTWRACCVCCQDCGLATTYAHAAASPQWWALRTHWSREGLRHRHTASACHDAGGTAGRPDRS